MRSRLQGPSRVVVALALVVVAGCYWSKYDKLARTHVQLLLSMAEKLEGVTRQDGSPPDSLAEYRYPLDRARDFVRIVGPRFASRPSLDALRRCCDAYAAVLAAAERWRPDADGEARAAMESAEAALAASAAATLRALDTERRA